MTAWAWVAVTCSIITVGILAVAVLWPTAEYLYLIWKGKDDGR